MTPLKVLEVEVNGPLQLLPQNYQVGFTVKALGEAAGPSNSLAGHAPPDLKFVSTKLRNWLDKGWLKLLMGESPDNSPLQGLMGVEGGLITEDH